MSTFALPARRSVAERPLRESLALVAHQIRYEQRAFWRNRRGAFFSFAFPVLLLVVLGALNGDQRPPELGGTRYITFFLPGILAYGLCMATFARLAGGIAARREAGILKRLRGTPLPAWVQLAGHVGSTVVTSAIMAVTTLAVGALAFGVEVRASTLPGLVASLVLGVLCFSALGAGVSAFVPSADAAPVLANVVLLPLTFISGVWSPTQGEPAWLRHVAEAFPIEHLAHALQAAFDPRTHGAALVGADLLALAIWTLVGARLTVRFLRGTMEP